MEQEIKTEILAGERTETQRTPDNVMQMKAPSLIPVNEHGQMMPQDHSQLVRLAQQMLKGGMIPRGYNTVEQVVTAWNLAASLRLAPAIAIRNIAVIDGSPSLFGDLPLALVQRSGELEYFEEYIFDKDYKKICFENQNLSNEVFGAVCFMQRKGQDKHSYSFSVDDAKKANLWGKTSGSGKLMPWSAYPKVMLTRRARSIAIKTEFAHILSGASIAEYDFNEAPDMRDVTFDETSSSDKLNSVFGGDNAKN